MKTNKEYPATHSMETRWFAMDLNGEIAIMATEQNGPVPIANGVKQDSDVDDYASELFWTEAKDEDSPEGYTKSGFYLYAQPLSPSMPLRRVGKPLFVSEINSLPEELRDFVVKLPIRFKDTPNIQLMEFIRCYHSNEPEYSIDGVFGFYKFQKPDGTWLFIKQEPQQGGECIFFTEDEAKIHKVNMVNKRDRNA